MSYCIYKTTNLINGKFYIGKDENNKLWYLGAAKWWREYWVKKREASCHVSF